MERQSQDVREGGQSESGERVPCTVSIEFGYLSPVPPEGDSWDEWVTEHGIAAADEQGTDIDDRTAHYIAAQLHAGQVSALYSLASSGAIDVEQIRRELAHGLDRLPDAVQRWATWLAAYCKQHGNRRLVAGWHERSRDKDRTDVERLRTEDVRAALDDLFLVQADEEVGDAHELGWFGLVRHDRRPGGWVISEDDQGFRCVWETDSDQELAWRWESVIGRYERFQQEVDQ